MTTKATSVMTTKITVRFTDKQYKVVTKAAKQQKMTLAEYVRQCVLY